MDIKNKLLAGLATLVLAGSAQAALMVESIDVLMVKTNFDSRSISGLTPDATAAALAGFQFSDAWDDPDKRICELSLAAFDNISSSGSCGGPNTNTGTLFTITGSSTGLTQMQLGLDWGLGGFTMLSMAGQATEFERYNSDIWWNLNWDHGDILDLIIPETAHFTLVGLGFEGCCDGVNSARWRSLDNNALSTFATGASGEWQTLAVNVPEPGVAYLLGLGLMGLLFSQRRLSRAISWRTAVVKD
jgi:hypothetical protein